MIVDRNSPQKHVWRAQVVLFTGDRVGTVNGGEKVGHGAAQNQASGGAPSAMARALIR